jgi:hypothetical protein
MISIFRFSAHKFTDTNTLTFSAIEYSKLKYGSKKYTQKLGMELASKFFGSLEFQNVQPNLFEKKIVVCSAPWKNIPVASTALKDYFISEFNPIWSVNNQAVEDLKVYREHSYNEDYGAMTKTEREHAITSDDFHIDKEFIKGKVLFFIDDIIITGAHERRIESLLNTAGFDGVVLFLYYAEYQGEDSPAIENELNYAFMKNLSDMDYIIKNEGLIFNTRLVKFMLNSPYYEFKKFISNQSYCFCSSLQTHIAGNEYHKIDEFKENYNQLKAVITHIEKGAKSHFYI